MRVQKLHDDRLAHEQGLSPPLVQYVRLLDAESFGRMLIFLVLHIA